MEHVYYSSTRGNKKNLLASQAILMGIAEDGGLFVPHKIDNVFCDLENLKDSSYKEVAYFIMSKFFTDFNEKELKECINKAYDNRFSCDDVVPIKKVGDTFFMELFHGPTLAFKDIALSILPHLITCSIKKQNEDKDVVILTATSGDTGKAALEGFANVKGTNIVVFFPEDGVSAVQKRQMVTQEGDNTCVIGIHGNFDDAQTGVKNIFADKELCKKLSSEGYVLSSANSINIGRLIPQIVYYFYGYLNLVKKGEIELGEKINVVVPTGNFGNILASYYAKAMGLPIKKFICASNENKVLSDFMRQGIYDRNRDFHITNSPSMDILVSSNLERFLYLITEGNAEEVKDFMEQLNTEGKYQISEILMNKLKDFYGGFATEDETLANIKQVFKSYGYLLDTHTSVAYSVYKDYLKETGDSAKAIIVATASPYKFTKSVMQALDDKYASIDEFSLISEMSKISNTDIPDPIKEIDKRKIIHKNTCEKNEMKCKITEFLNSKF